MADAAMLGTFVTVHIIDGDVMCREYCFDCEPQASIGVMAALHVGKATYPPPTHLPDLHLLFCAQWSCALFVTSLVSSYGQIFFSCTGQDEDVSINKKAT